MTSLFREVGVRKCFICGVNVPANRRHYCRIPKSTAPDCNDHDWLATCQGPYAIECTRCGKIEAIQEKNQGPDYVPSDLW